LSEPRFSGLSEFTGFQEYFRKSEERALLCNSAGQINNPTMR
jgi:hypothetical protein